ncbi:MAG: hypothetical protein HUJ63_01120, partial [Enterococcus sp.]|nr:hypothetical protein [Enterococcus sp.]
ELLCGSVENFLKDPSQLSDYEFMDKNFSWMRAVTPEEARNAMENWQKLISQPRPLKTDNSEPISDWIFSQTYRKTIIKSLLPIDEKTAQPITPEPPQEKEMVNEPLKPITKKKFLEELLKVCDKNGRKYQKYYKTENWECDVIITTEVTCFSFSVLSSKQQGEKAIETIMSNGVNAFGFVLKQSHKEKRDTFSRILEVFQGENGLCVSVMGKNLTIGEFVEAIVSGRLVAEESYLATAMNVAFIPDECYFCKRQHHIYMVHSLVNSENEIVYDNHGHDSLFDFSQFSPSVMNPIKQFISEHPEKNIVMGEIKPRTSKTIGKEYTSFGCPYCDGIVGNHYLKEIESELIYSIEAKDCEVIPLQEPVEIKIRHWKMQ